MVALQSTESPNVYPHPLYASVRCWLLGSGSFDGSLLDRGSVITRCAVRIGR